MNKFLPIIIAVVVIAAIAIGGWFLLKNRGAMPSIQAPIGETQEAVTPEEETKGFTGKLKDALNLGQAMKCTWEQDEDNFGTAYIKNEKVHTDVTYEGKRAHSIMDGDCTYTWEEGAVQGFELCVEPEEVEVEEVEEMEEAEPELPEEYQAQVPDVNYTCEPAVVSDAMFELPSEVNFINPLELMGE